MSVGLAIGAIVRRDWGAAVLHLASAIYLGHAAALPLSTVRARRRGHVRLTVLDAAGTELPGAQFGYSRIAYYLGGALALMTFVGSAVVVAALVTWFRAAVSASVLVLLALLVVMALGAVFFFVLMVHAWRVRGRVVLTPRGLYHRRLSFEHFLPWDAVFEVVADESPAGHLITAKAEAAADTWVHRTRPKGNEVEFGLLPYLVVFAEGLAVDPALLYHAMRYYFLHPEHRAELGTDAALDRIRRGAVVVPEGSGFATGS